MIDYKNELVRMVENSDYKSDYFWGVIYYFVRARLRNATQN